MPLLSTPTIAPLHLQNTKHGNICRNIAALTAASTSRARLSAQSVWMAFTSDCQVSPRDQEYSGRTIPESCDDDVGNPHLEVANCICICTPRNGQDRGRPLSNHPRIGLPAAANKAAWKNGQTPPARRPRTPSRLTINVQTAIRNTGNARLTLSPAHHTAVPTSSPHLQHSGRCVWPCFAHRPRPSTHHRHHRPAAVRGGPPAPPETNARVSRVPTALPATPPERTFSLFIFAPFCADGLHHAAKFAPGS